MRRKKYKKKCSTLKYTKEIQEKQEENGISQSLPLSCLCIILSISLSLSLSLSLSHTLLYSSLQPYKSLLLPFFLSCFSSLHSLCFLDLASPHQPNTILFSSSAYSFRFLDMLYSTAHNVLLFIFVCSVILFCFKYMFYVLKPSSLLLLLLFFSFIHLCFSLFVFLYTKVM